MIAPHALGGWRVILDAHASGKGGSREIMADISQALNAIGSHRLVRDVITKLSQ